MTTFGSVKTAIARRLMDTSNTAVTDVEIGEAINEAISMWKKKRFWFNETVGSLTLAADDVKITLPSDFLIDIPRNALIIFENDDPRQVKKKTPSVFDGLSNNTGTGRPCIYVYRNGALEIYPKANKAYTGKLYYLKEYEAFLTDGSQDNLDNDFLIEAMPLIRNQALADLHGELRQDEKMEARYLKKVATEYATLDKATNKLLRTGTLTIEQ